jgi:glycerol-3-phosphate O-acyltransferase
MTDNLVTIPQWLFWLLLLLALVSLLHFFWLMLLRYFRSQSIKTQRRLDEKLMYGLSPHTLKNRRQWKWEILDDRVLKEIIKEYAAENKITEEETRKRVDDYLEEIVPSFNMIFYFRLGFWLARGLLRSLYTVHVGYADTDAYDGIKKNSCVIVMSNHRSNFDPLIHIYLASRRSTISFSAGEWARGWPFRQLLHAIGFYIVRRNSNDDLYRRVLERYIIHSVSHCIPLGLFVEGSLSRDGMFQKMKLGTLNYAIKALGKGECDDIVIIPAAISYDKTPEDKTLVEHQRVGFKNKGRLYSLGSLLKFVARTGFKLFQRRYKPFGYACVNYGKPISLVDWQKEQGLNINTLPLERRHEAISELGKLLGESIRSLVPVPPISILAKVIVEHPQQTIAAMVLKVQAYKIISQLRKENSRLVLPEEEDNFAFDQGISILVKHHIIDPTYDDAFKIIDDQKPLLEYYAGILMEQRKKNVE